MFRLSGTKKFCATVLCAAVTLNMALYYAGEDAEQNFGAEAKTLAEIQEERKSNEAQIAELEEKISSLEGQKENEKAYQETLSQQIEKIQENIQLLDTELAQIDTDIATAQTNIENLNGEIAGQQTEVDNNIELFKERLCAMYVTGNDSLALAVFGSDDFYDMLSRVEMINSIAEHDEELVNGLLDEINTLEKSKSDLEAEKLTLEAKQEEQTLKKKEKEDEITQLGDKMKKSKDEIDRLQREEDIANSSKADLEALNDDLEKQSDEIEAQIRAAEEAKKLAAQKAAEEAASKNRPSSSGSSGSGGGQSQSGQSQQVADLPQTSAGAGGFAWPVPGYYYTSSGFGSRWGSHHNGIDISGGGISGAAVCASKSGVVISVVSSCSHNYPKSGNCCGNGYGNYVTIAHDGTYSTVYAHLASAAVSVGEYVSQGQVIGYVGSTGFSTGYHLHFEVRVNGAPQNPRNYV